MTKRSLKKQIRESAVKRGDFTLSSGKKSSYYLDLKLAYTRPEVMNQIVKALVPEMKKLKADRIAGMELGAVPLAVAISLKMKIPFMIIRKEVKGHGAAKRIEGALIKGEKVVIVEDVATTGGSIASAVKAVRERGGVCTEAITIIDRREGAKENLQKINIDLIPLLTIEDLGI